MEFWNTVKIFLTNKDFLRNHNIIVKLKDGSVTDKVNLSNLFNSHYTDIVENNPGMPPVTQSNPVNKNKANTTKIIVSITNIKSTAENPIVKFSIPTAKTVEVKKIIKNLSLKKAASGNKVSPKVLNLAANIIELQLTNIINKNFLFRRS